MSLGMLSRLAWRESRTARRRLLLYMSSISLGVAALVAIDSFATNTQDSIRTQSRALLGGDVAFSANQKFPAAIDSIFDSLATGGLPIARVTTFGSMAFVPRTGGTRLTQVRAINTNFPLYGDVVTEPAGAWARLRTASVAVVDPTLLIALDARVGDTLQVGYAKFEIAGAVTSVPGDPGIASAIGPRVFIADQWIGETQLLGFGSRAQYEAFVKLPAGVNSPKWSAPLRPKMLKANVRMRTVVQQEMNFTQAIGQMASFLGLVGLIALLLGGVGVASGVHAFVTRKVDTVAVLRCLGATSAQVLFIYVMQAAVMGLLGAAIGAALGVAIQFGLPLLVKDFLPLDVQVSLDPVALGTGLAMGVSVALIFALRPLLALRRVSPLQALRRDDAALTRASLRDPATQAVNLTLVVSVILLAIARADTVPRGLMFAVGIGLSLVVLYLAASSLSEGARRLVRGSWPYVLRQGVANLYRPANQTRSVVIALGFGSFLVTTIYLVQANLVRQFDITAAASKGNLVMFDIQDDQRPGVEQAIADGKHRLISMTPIVTMRIAAINGQEAVEHARRAGQGRGSWGLRREYRSTYRDTVVVTEKVVAGRWFGEHAASDTLHEVSLDRDLATEQLKVKLGDIIAWDVQGVRIATRVTSFREIDWGRFDPNFFAVFNPAAISAAPKQWAAVAAIADEKAIAPLQRRVVERFPNVSSLDISLVRRTITDIINKVSLAVRFLALFCLGMGVPVLFSAVAATRRDRLRESVLLKTLGATQRQVLRILFTEYALLGTLGGLCGMGLATLGGWALVTFVFESPFTFAFGPAAAIAGAMLGMAVGIGLLTAREVFRETPMAALRDV
ncbi:MAG: FtsX-like permease family protein [Gemmatimonadota bacterium]|nr:FtsX-like permease family protein [Gemmatimonadota bacterium]